MPPAAATSTGTTQSVQNIQEATPPPDTHPRNSIPERIPVPRPTTVEVAVEEVGETDRGAVTEKSPDTPSTPDASPDQDASSGDPWTEDYPNVCVGCVCVCGVCVCVCVYVCVCVRVCRQSACFHLLSSLTMQVTPTAALRSTEQRTPIQGEDSDSKEDTLQPTQVDLSMAPEPVRF